jgi:hypothetical protein
MLGKSLPTSYIFSSDCATSKHTQVVLKHTQIDWKPFCLILESLFMSINFLQKKQLLVQLN